MAAAAATVVTNIVAAAATTTRFERMSISASSIRLPIEDPVPLLRACCNFLAPRFSGRPPPGRPRLVRRDRATVAPVSVQGNDPLRRPPPAPTTECPTPTRRAAPA